MKELLAVISLLVSGALSVPQSGPYPPSGWKPSGPAFEIPQPGAQRQPAEYLPPVDPRNPTNIPSAEYGPPQDQRNPTDIPSTEYGPPQDPSTSGSIPSVEYGVPEGPSVAANTPNVGVDLPQNPNIGANTPGVGLGIPQDPRNAANTPSVGLGFPQGPSITATAPGLGIPVGPGTSPNGPSVGLGIPGGPGITATAPGVGLGIPGAAAGISPNGPSVGLGIPGGPGIAATAPGVGLGIPGAAAGISPNGPSVGLGIPGGPGIAATAPGIGLGIPGAAAGISPNGPSVGLGIPGGPGIGVGVPQGPGVFGNGPRIGLGASADILPDVSVQGLPPQKEDVPLFQPSPIGGLPSVGFGFNAHIRNLNENLYQNQYQQQQRNYREFERQRQLEARIAASRLQRPERPAAFGARTTPATTEISTPEDTTLASTTEISLNEGETFEVPKKKEKVTVELTAQKLQEYPGEFFLSSLAQLQLQPQFAPQFGQLKAPLNDQTQNQLAGFDAQTHFAALPSIIAQQKMQQQKVLIAGQPQTVPELQFQPQAFYPQRDVESVTQYQPEQLQPQVQSQPQLQLQPLPQYAAQPVQFQPQLAQFQPQPAQFQPQTFQFQPQPAPFQPQTGQFQPQLVRFQPQPTLFQPQPDNKDVENIDQSSYQPQIYQQQLLVPQSVNQPQPGYVQAKFVKYPVQDFSKLQGDQFQQQNQFPPASQGADALQSGLDVSQQGNNVDEPQDQEEDQNEGTTATAIATAFGTRTQPRRNPKYGIPSPVLKVKADSAGTTTESPAEEVTDEGPVVVQAVAIADGTRRKSAKLRRNRVRPIFTLDKSGHLVLAQSQ